MDIVQLGRTDEQINCDILAAQSALNGDISEEQKNKINHEISTFQTELNANHIVAAWLAAAQSVGELQDIKLSSLYIATESRKDSVNLLLLQAKKDSPRATEKQIEALRTKATAMVNKKYDSGGETRDVTINKKIYIFTDTIFFNFASKESNNFEGFGVVKQSDYNIVGAGVVGHEEYHVRFGALERPAYREELRILRKFTPEAIGNTQFIESEKINKAAKGRVKYP